MPWRDNVLLAFRRHACPELRRVVLGALNTGQRNADIRALSWVHGGPDGI